MFADLWRIGKLVIENDLIGTAKTADAVVLVTEWWLIAYSVTELPLLATKDAAGTLLSDLVIEGY